MHEHSERTLHNHGDLLAMGRSREAEQAAVVAPRDVARLMAVAHRAKHALPSVRPRSTFRERLRDDLMAAASYQAPGRPVFAVPWLRRTPGRLVIAMPRWRPLATASRLWQSLRSGTSGLRRWRRPSWGWKGHLVAAASGIAAGSVITAAAMWWLIRGGKASASATEAG